MKRHAARELSTPEKHQLRVALDTLKMNDVMARVMGGPSKDEARAIVARLRPKKNPALHSAKSIGSNMLEVDHGSVYILYSYETPVAVYPREGVGSKPLVTSFFHSRTTSKHIGQWLRMHGFTLADAVKVSQEEIDAAAKRGHYTKLPPELRENPAGLKWNTYAGGIGAAEGKHSYDAYIPGGQYIISPFTTQYGRHAGYILNFANTGSLPIGISGLYSGVAADGTAIAVHQKGSVYRSPVAAKKAARLHYERYGGQKNPRGRVRRVVGYRKRTVVRRRNPLEYRTVDTTTVKGIEEAEKLHTSGWKMVRPGMFSIQFERKTPGKARRILTTRRPRRTVRSNPPLAVLGNPPDGARDMGQVSYLEYTHRSDGKRYYHHFRPAVRMTALSDGRVVLWHPKHKLFDQFEVGSK